MASMSGFAGGSARSTQESCFEENFYACQDFRGAFRIVNGFAEGGASGDSVGKPARELLHLADGVGELFLDQHLEIGADHLVAVGFRRVLVSARIAPACVAPDAFVRSGRRPCGLSLDN